MQLHYCYSPLHPLLMLLRRETTQRADLLGFCSAAFRCSSAASAMRLHLRSISSTRRRAAKPSAQRVFSLVAALLSPLQCCFVRCHLGFSAPLRVRPFSSLWKELSVDWSSVHSAKECVHIARVLDAMIAEDLELALELLCRRLGAVDMGARTGNWALCEELERGSASSSQSFLPRHTIASALKTVNAFSAAKNGGTSSSSSFTKSSSSGGKGGERTSGKGPRFTNKAAAAKAAAAAASSAEGAPGANSSSSKKKPAIRK